MLRWLTSRASNESNWSPEYAETPWAEFSGDAVVIHNFRNCEYRSATEVIPRWETRTVHLSRLRGADFLMNDFGSRRFAHTLLSFDFGDDGYVCVSIEARRQHGESYSPVRGLLRRYELYYVIGDERDVLLLRTKHRQQDVYLYRLADAEPERWRSLFLCYMRAANELRERPRWYHSVFDNCTTNIQEHALESGFASAWDWRVLANGHADELLHRRGMLATQLPFAETKARARINDRAAAAGTGDDFSQRIRAL
jgi:hypothetical protein